MAIALDKAQVVTTAVSGNVETCPFTIAFGSNRILIVHVSFIGSMSGVGVSSVTFNGMALKFMGADYLAATGTEIWYIIPPTIGTFNIVVTYTGAPTNVGVAAYSLTGVDQTIPFRAGLAFHDGSGEIASSIAVSVAGNNGDAIFTVGTLAYIAGGGPAVPSAPTVATTLAYSGTVGNPAGLNTAQFSSYKLAYGGGIASAGWTVDPQSHEYEIGSFTLAASPNPSGPYPPVFMPHDTPDSLRSINSSFKP